VVATLGLLSGALPSVSWGQAFERNLPAAPQSVAEPIAQPAPETAAAPAVKLDDTPIGPALKGVVLLGPADEVRTAAVRGVNAGLVPRLNTTEARDRLKIFLGRRLSRKLIAQVEEAINRAYARADHPYVSLSVPPQSFEGGVLQVRVLEFHAGAVAVTGVSGRRARDVRRQIRLQPGQAIDAADLSDDLDWLNLYPFRHAEAAFSAGDAQGGADLDVSIAPIKPWQVYTGYANSGSPLTSWDRYFIGGRVGGLLIPGSLLSYQFTASPDFFDDQGRPFGETEHPHYLSHGLRASAPIAPRQAIEISFDHVESNTNVDFLKLRQVTDELAIGYRTALSNLTNLRGDLTLGVEVKGERRDTIFNDGAAFHDAVEIYQFYGGWIYAWSDGLGRTAFNVAIHGSPGGVDYRNSAAAFTAFTGGRVKSGGYAYVNAQLARSTPLPAGWSLSNVVIGQYAGEALPDTEQLAVGGADLVRGYSLDDGAYDSAIISRNELRSPTAPILARVAPIADRVSPFAFFDVGYGIARTTLRSINPESAGAGVDYQLGAHLTLDLTGAYVLRDGVQIKRGGGRLELRATSSF